MVQGAEYRFEDVEIQETPKTPYIKLLIKEGVIELKGILIPENPMDFYEDLNQWLVKYADQPAKLTTINLAFTYINSSSSVVIMRMLKKLDILIGQDNQIVVNWYYEIDDLDMQNLGLYFKEELTNPIIMHEVVNM